MFFIHYLSIISDYIKIKIHPKVEVLVMFGRINLSLKSGSILLGAVLTAVVSNSTMADSNWRNYGSVKTRPSYSQQSYQHDQVFKNGSNLNHDRFGGAFDRPSPPKHYPQAQYRYGSQYPQKYPQRYPQQRPYPVYPQQNGVTIIYNHQFPTQTEYRTESYGFVNGNGTIESSSYTLISDWHRYNLPAPSAGMHWIYQNGRYMQMPNQR